MDREELRQFVLSNYSAEPDRPWLNHPRFEVFRHSNNQKWFALVMDIPKSKLGLPSADMIDVVNLKCDPILVGSLRGDAGIFPAYHMSKVKLDHGRSGRQCAGRKAQGAAGSELRADGDKAEKVINGYKYQRTGVK